MDNVQPSFIPKRPVTQPVGKPKRNVSFFSLIATVIFITSLVIWGAVFGYKYYLDSDLTSKQASLQAELDKFQSSLVADLSRLDTRISTANDLLTNHISVSTLLSVINNFTLRNIRFSGFTYSAQDPKAPSISMGGQADSFISIALQGDELTKPDYTKYIKNPILGNPNLDKDGHITFSFNSTIDPQALSYSLLMKPQGVTLSSTTPQVASSTTATSTTKTATSTKPKSP
jgi:hypothetical protein